MGVCLCERRVYVCALMCKHIFYGQYRAISCQSLSAADQISGRNAAVRMAIWKINPCRSANFVDLGLLSHSEMFQNAESPNIK